MELASHVLKPGQQATSCETPTCPGEPLDEFLTHSQHLGVADGCHPEPVAFLGCSEDEREFAKFFPNSEAMGSWVLERVLERVPEPAPQQVLDRVSGAGSGAGSVAQVPERVLERVP